MTLSEFSVNRPVTALVAFFAALVVGGICLWQIPLDLMPQMDIPAISVITTYEGAAPEDIEEKVTDILERSLSTVPDLKHITSTSREGVSIITLNFEWGTDLDARANDVRDSVGQAKMHLIDETDEPRVFRFNISQFPIMVYGVHADESYPRLEKLLDDVVVQPIKRLPGVGSAEAHVPLYRQVNVDLDRERLASYNLTPQDVARAIVGENVDTPAGNVKAGLTDYLIRVPGQFHDIPSMRQIVLAARGNAVVRLSDVASVEDGFDEQRRYIKINSKPGGVVIVQKQSGANTVKVAKLVQERLKELKPRLPADVELVNIMDSSEDIRRMVRDLSETLFLAIVLTTLIVWVFLRRWRATFVVGLTIPFSLIVGIIVVFFMGKTMNMITLFGLTIAVGRVVDDAIVILENITRHREEGERPKEGAVYGASEVGMAVVASTLTAICIFFPILFVKGMTKVLFTEFAIVVCVVLVGSLFSALTLTPVLSSTLMRGENFGSEGRGAFYRWSENFLARLIEFYDRVLSLALGHRTATILTALAIFLSSIAMMPFLGSEFLPQEDRAMVQGSVYLPVGTRVEETARVMNEIDRIIGEEIPDKERLGVFVRCGTSQEGASGMFGEEGTHIGLFGVKLVPKGKRARDTSQIASAIRKRVNNQRAALGFDKFILQLGDPMEAMILSGELPITVNIMGDDFDEMDKLAEKIKKIVETTPGTVDVNISRVKGRPELWVNADRDKASSLGLNVSSIGDTMRTAFSGAKAGKYRIRGEEFDILVRVRQGDRSNISDVLATPLRLPSGRVIHTDNVASLAMQYGPVTIDRKDRGRIIRVVGNIDKRSLGDVADEIEAKVRKLEIPSGIEITMGGQTEEQRESFFWLGICLIVGMILVYMVMASQFESWVDPFVVMFSVPFGFTGAIWAIMVSGFHISMVVFIGLLLLIGIVVSNAILLVDYSNILRARGLEMIDAVRKAGRTRLRPVLMTALATICGLMPMAFAKGQGSEVWNPLGLTVMGGMLISTAVTLIIVPTMYTVFERRSKKRTT